MIFIKRKETKKKKRKNSRASSLAQYIEVTSQIF